MGRKKSQIGRIRKDEERKRQAPGKYSVGRTPKRCQSNVPPPAHVTTPPDHDVIGNLRSTCYLPPHWVNQSTGSTAAFCKIVQDTPEHGPQLSRGIV